MSRGETTERSLRISLAIATHPVRKELAEALAQACEPVPADIIYDPDPDGPPSALRTAALAWSSAPSWATHHVVLQDDVRPCNSFEVALRRTLRLEPTAVMSLFTLWTGKGSQLVRLAATADFRCVGAADLSCLSSPGLAMPVDHALEYGKYLAEGSPITGWRDAAKLQDFVRERRLPVILSVPCLIEHDIVTSTSLLPHRARKGIRKAAYFEPNLSSDQRSATFRHLRSLRALPYLSDDDIRGYVCEGSTDLRRAWEWLESVGRSVTDLEASWRAELTRSYAAASLMHWLSPRLLFEAWTVAMASGVVLREVSPDLDLTGRVLPAADTLIVGSVAHIVSPRVLDEIRSASGEYVSSALCAGFAGL